jgi:hypothetical protein
MNDFVNPQHRGVNLPDGFKDLVDVLDAKKKSPLIKDSGETGTTRVTRGGLSEIEKHVCDVLESKAGFVMMGILPLRRDAVKFYLLRKKSGCIAPFAFHERDAVPEKIVREVFAEQGIIPILDRVLPELNHKILQYSLPASLPAIAMIACEVFQRDYGVAESNSLTFMFYESD